MAIQGLMIALAGLSLLADGARISVRSQESQVDSASNRRCECWVKQARTNSISDWIDLAITQNLEACCENYASVFGWWGASGCPDTLGDVRSAIRKGTQIASGGKSGTKPIFAGNYVVKIMSKEERGYLDGVLDQLREVNKNYQFSFLAPICRVLKVTGPKISSTYVMVMASVSLAGAEVHPYHAKFDLKGNWAYKNRMANSSASVLKDGNFHNLFPDGMHVTKMYMQDTYAAENAASDIFSNFLKGDTKSLLDVGLMDYSLLVDMVEVCSERPTQCPDQVSVKVDRFSLHGTDRRPYKLGIFNKACLLPKGHHAERPIYVNSQKEYLFYRKELGEWRIGPNPDQMFSHVATKRDDFACPHEGNQSWKVYPYSFGISVTIEVVQESVPMPTQDSIMEQNPGKPVVWAYANNKIYAMAMGIIDLFMHGKHRGFVNTLASGISFSACAPDDIDPIPAREYRVRFLRMMGYKDPSVTNKAKTICGACLGEKSYTYFTHMLQTWLKDRWCEWG